MLNLFVTFFDRLNIYFSIGSVLGKAKAIVLCGFQGSIFDLHGLEKLDIFGNCFELLLHYECGGLGFAAMRLNKFFLVQLTLCGQISAFVALYFYHKLYYEPNF